MKKTAFWITTGLATAAFALGGVMDLARGADMEAAMAHLGYPAYLMTLLGAWKLLGAAAIAAPRLGRLKEWAYAGMFFDLTGAAFSHASSGDPVAKIATPLALLAIVMTSWALRPADRTISAAEVETVAPAPRLRAA
ncbi:MAG TPA: DoxX family protein [Kofleriaceae bacterium]|jgi:hypothetical protein|nr:DoxX family protein [Kofleriaceae bacterium]